MSELLSASPSMCDFHSNIAAVNVVATSASRKATLVAASVLPTVPRKPFPRALLIVPDSDLRQKLFIALTSRRFCVTALASVIDALPLLSFPKGSSAFDVVFLDFDTMSVDDFELLAINDDDDDDVKTQKQQQQPAYGVSQTTASLFFSNQAEQASRTVGGGHAVQHDQHQILVAAAISEQNRNTNKIDKNGGSKNKKNNTNSHSLSHSGNGNAILSPSQFVHLLRIKEHAAETALGRGIPIVSSAGSSSFSATSAGHKSAGAAVSSSAVYKKRVMTDATITETEQVRVVRDGLRGLSGEASAALSLFAQEEQNKLRLQNEERKKRAETQFRRQGASDVFSRDSIVPPPQSHRLHYHRSFVNSGRASVQQQQGGNDDDSDKTFMIPSSAASVSTFGRRRSIEEHEEKGDTDSDKDRIDGEDSQTEAEHPDPSHCVARVTSQLYHRKQRAKKQQQQQQQQQHELQPLRQKQNRVTVRGAAAQNLLYSSRARYIVIGLVSSMPLREKLADLCFCTATLTLEVASLLATKSLVTREHSAPLLDALLRYPLKTHLDALEAAFVSQEDGTVSRFAESPSLAGLGALITDVTQRRLGGMMRVVSAPSSWQRLTEAVRSGDHDEARVLLQPIPRPHRMEKDSRGVSSVLTNQAVDLGGMGDDISAATAHALFRAQSDVKKAGEALQLEKDSLDAVNMELEASHVRCQGLVQDVERSLAEQKRLEEHVKFLQEQLGRQTQECATLQMDATNAMAHASEANAAYERVCETCAAFSVERQKTRENHDEEIAAIREAVAAGRSIAGAINAVRKRQAAAAAEASGTKVAAQDKEDNDDKKNNSASPSPSKRRNSPPRGASSAVVSAASAASSMNVPVPPPPSAAATASARRGSARASQQQQQRQQQQQQQQQSVKKSSPARSPRRLGSASASASGVAGSGRGAALGAFKTFNAAQFLAKQDARCIEIEIGLPQPLYLDLLADSRRKCISYMQENVKLRSELFDAFSVIYELQCAGRSASPAAGAAAPSASPGSGIVASESSFFGNGSSEQKSSSQNANIVVTKTTATTTTAAAAASTRSRLRSGSEANSLTAPMSAAAASWRAARTMSFSTEAFLHPPSRISKRLSSSDASASGAAAATAADDKGDPRRQLSVSDELLMSTQNDNPLSRDAVRERDKTWKQKMQKLSQHYELKMMEAMEIVSAVTVDDNVLAQVKDGIKFKSANYRDYDALRDARCKCEFSDDDVRGVLIDGGKAAAAAAAAAAESGLENINLNNPVSVLDAAINAAASSKSADASVGKSNNSKAINISAGGSAGTAAAVINSLVASAQSRSQEPVKLCLQTQLEKLWSTVRMTSQSSLLEVMTTHSAIGSGLERLLSGLGLSREQMEQEQQMQRALQQLVNLQTSSSSSSSSSSLSSATAAPSASSLLLSAASTTGAATLSVGGRSPSMMVVPGSGTVGPLSSSSSSQQQQQQPTAYYYPAPTTVTAAVNQLVRIYLEQHPPSPPQQPQQQPQQHQQPQRSGGAAVKKVSAMARRIAHAQLGQSLRRLFLDRLTQIFNNMQSTLAQNYSHHIVDMYRSAEKTMHEEIKKSVTPLALENAKLATALLVAKTAAHSAVSADPSATAKDKAKVEDFWKAVNRRDGWCQTRPVIIRDPIFDM